MIVWADGFDHYGTGSGGADQMLEGAYAATSTGPTTDQARTGTCSFPCSGNNGQIRRVFGSALELAGLAAAFYLTSLPDINQACAPFTFRDSANKPQICIEIQTTGIIAVWRGAGDNNFGAKLGESSTLIAPASWNHLEVKAGFDGATGSVEVRLNGVTIVNLTGVNTVNSTSPATGELSASQVILGFVTNDNGRTMYVDDLVLWDGTGSYNNDFIGDQKVFTDMPIADTADVDWTPSTGSARYAMIDEIPANDDTDYDETLSNGDRMGVTFPALDGAVSSVAAVLFYAKTRKTDAGVCNVQVQAESSGSSALGADNPITTAYTYRWDVFETDPHTAAPWTPSNAGAAAMVLERTA